MLARIQAAVRLPTRPGMHLTQCLIGEEMLGISPNFRDGDFPKCGGFGYKVRRDFTR